MRGGMLERKIDRLEANAELDIEAAYDEALTKAMRKNRDTLKRMRAIMDGEENPPRYCVTEKQKERWKMKTLMKLLNASGINESMGNALAEAGRQSVSRIQRFGLDVYETAYKGTMNKLKE